MRVLAAQDPGAHRVEREDPHPLGDAAADECLDPLRHLASGLVREGDREDRSWSDAFLADQVGDPVCERARLARSGPRDDEHRALRVEDGLSLDVVEPLDQGGDVEHPGIIEAAGDPVGPDQVGTDPEAGRSDGPPGLDPDQIRCAAEYFAIICCLLPPILVK